MKPLSNNDNVKFTKIHYNCFTKKPKKQRKIMIFIIYINLQNILIFIIGIINKYAVENYIQ